MKSNISANEGSFKTHRAYSPEEILAAGGATAFGHKTNKNNLNLIKALENTPVAEAFTKEEWDNLVSELDNDK
ncbi:hypothetical protein ACPPVU_21335 [Mucilaginibacter sp. McL0603]|uniref:hypothetical protein n=1 Tax=Mucilaginibacter sp. McL0603 TaxID=3415670 RepID=UPI003CF81462